MGEGNRTAPGKCRQHQGVQHVCLQDPEVDKVVLQHPKWQVEGRLKS